MAIKPWRFFVKVSDFSTLEQRLKGRGTESHDSLARRVAKAKEESLLVDQFDTIVINDELPVALRQAEELVRIFLSATSAT
ncbi:MAG: hypothetical protein HC842_04815 [Cytophagales bacterium]|nr:hypothetical protein [Cytophagales bacterium]